MEAPGTPVFTLLLPLELPVAPVARLSALQDITLFTCGTADAMRAVDRRRLARAHQRPAAKRPAAGKRGFQKTNNEDDGERCCLQTPLEVSLLIHGVHCTPYFKSNPHFGCNHTTTGDESPRIARIPYLCGSPPPSTPATPPPRPSPQIYTLSS